MDKVIALDTEIIDDSLYCVSFADEEQLGLSYYVPPFMEVLDKDLLVFHNAKFDLKYLPFRQFKLFDTMIAHWLLYEDEPKGLKYVAKKFLNVEKGWDKLDEVIRGKIPDIPKNYTSNTVIERYLGQFAKEYPEQFSRYTELDAKYTYELFQILQPELEKQGLIKIFNLEMKVIPIILQMEQKGVKLDLEKEQEIREEIKEARNDTDRAIRERVKFELLEAGIETIIQGT